MENGSVFAVVLAAGESSRFGSTKQLAAFAGGTLVGNAIRTAESVFDRRSVLVAGKDWQDVLAACAPLAGFFVVNEHYEEGMSTSVRTGVRAVAGVADAVLLMLADQPLVTASHLEALIRAWQKSTDSIVASAYAETLGPPAIFPSRTFSALCSLEGDQGAKPLIEAGGADVVSVSLDGGDIDVDTPEDLTALN